MTKRYRVIQKTKVTEFQTDGSKYAYPLTIPISMELDLEPIEEEKTIDNCDQYPKCFGECCHKETAENEGFEGVPLEEFEEGMKEIARLANQMGFKNMEETAKKPRRCPHGWAYGDNDEASDGCGIMRYGIKETDVSFLDQMRKDVKKWTEGNLYKAYEQQPQETATEENCGCKEAAEESGFFTVCRKCSPQGFMPDLPDETATEEDNDFSDVDEILKDLPHEHKWDRIDVIANIDGLQKAIYLCHDTNCGKYKEVNLTKE